MIRRESRNCKVEGECVALEEQFLCKDGLCQNISRIMTCDYTEVQSDALHYTTVRHSSSLYAIMTPKPKTVSLMHIKGAQ